MVLINESSESENTKTEIESLIDETNFLFDSINPTEQIRLVSEKIPNEKEIKKSSTKKEISEKEEYIEEEDEDDEEEIEKEVKKLIPNLSAKKKEFYMKWYKFMRYINQVPDKLPVMGFKPLDLYNLYHLVISQGGYEKVNKLHGEGVWIKIFKKIDNYKSTITNASVRLKKYYHTYLFKFENQYFDKSSFNTPNIGRVLIEVGNISFEGEIFDNSTGKEFISKLPLETKAVKFGDFFKIKNEKMNSNMEKAKKYYKDGDILFDSDDKEIFFCFGNVPEKEDKMTQDDEEEDEEKEGEEDGDEDQGDEEYDEDIHDEEKKLNSKCNILGRISLNLESISQVKRDSIVKIKFISHEQKKKRTIKTSDSHIEPKKKRTRQSGTSSDIKPTSFFSGHPLISIKYKYEGESDADSKLIKTEAHNISELSSKDVQKYLIEDNVNFDELDEIRYYEYSDDEDSEGWALMTEKFSLPIENKTRIKLKLRRGKLGEGKNIFKRKTNEIQNFTLFEDAEDHEE